MLKPMNFLSGIVLFVFGLVATPVRADDLDELFKEAVSLYESGHIEDSLAAFKKMQEIDKGYRYYYNIGQCEFGLKRYGLAIEAFNSFLSGLEEEELKKQRSHAEEVVKTITPLVGELKLEGEGTIQVWVDDVHRADTPLTKALLISEGEHQIRLTKDDNTLLEQKVTITGGAKTILVIPASAKPPDSPKETEQKILEPSKKITSETTVLDTPVPEKRDRNLSPIFWAGLAGTVVFAGVCGAMWGVTSSKKHEYEDAVNELNSKMSIWDFTRPEDDLEERELREQMNELANETEGLNRVAVAMTIVTGAFAALTVVGLFLKSSKKEPSRNRVTAGAGGLEVRF